jgi:hypothetical protein
MNPGGGAKDSEKWGIPRTLAAAQVENRRMVTMCSLALRHFFSSHDGFFGPWPV